MSKPKRVRVSFVLTTVFLVVLVLYTIDSCGLAYVPVFRHYIDNDPAASLQQSIADDRFICSLSVSNAHVRSAWREKLARQETIVILGFIVNIKTINDGVRDCFILDNNDYLIIFSGETVKYHYDQFTNRRVHYHDRNGTCGVVDPYRLELREAGVLVDSGIVNTVRPDE